MPNEFLVEGLKTALIKGESLRQAMISFDNAGYDLEEIKAAARVLQGQGIDAPVRPQAIPIQKLSKQTIFKQPQKIQFLNEKTSQVSNYNQEPKQKKTLVILLISSLVVLLGALGGVFIFKDELINFFNNLF